MKLPKTAIGLVSLLSIFVFCSQMTKGDFVQQQSNKTERTYYPSGKLKLEIVYNEQGELQRTVTYYESGVKESDFALKDGPCTRFFENGDTLTYSLKKSGIPEGRVVSYYRKKQLAYEQFYTNGFKSGTWRYYNENGSLREEVSYLELMSPANSSDYSDNKYYSNNQLAYTVAIRDGKGSDTIIIDPQGFAALAPSTSKTGKVLFQQHCAMCHAIARDVVGPMMKGVTKKRKKEWLVEMITNAPQLIGKGDKEAIALYEKWNKTAHPDYSETLSREEVLLIIDYLKTVN